MIISLLICVLISFSVSIESFADCKGMVLIDAQNKRVLYEKEKDKKLPMASTTKIMTALLTLEETDLDKEFIVDKTAIKVEGSSMGLVENDRVSLRDLSVGMLLASGNDAANAAAVRISGSVSEFVKNMNKRAAEIGMVNTNFETPSGLDGENHYSTAYDMAILASSALKNPDFAKVCSQKSVKLEYGNPPYARWLSNHNRLLKVVPEATGIKTGFTKKAGRCLVSSAEKDEVSLICVTLNCSDDWNVHKNIYNDYFEKLSSKELKDKVESVVIPVCGGTKESVTASVKSVKASLLDGEEDDIVYTVIAEPFVFAPVRSGDVVGKVKFYLKNDFIAETPLLANDSVYIRDGKDSLFQKIKNSLTNQEK